MNKKLVEHFCQTLGAATRSEPIEWIRSNVIEQQSARAPSIDLSLSPFLLKPLHDFLHNDEVQQINILAPTGSGKSTFFIGLLNYLIAFDAGNTLLAFQNEQEAADFSETRLFPSITNNRSIRGLLPTRRHSLRKTEIIFPHMNLWAISATSGQLQSKSCRYLIGDEVFQWDKGMIREFKARSHDRFNRKILLVSQGGYKGTDWQEETSKGRQFFYAWECPHCGAKNVYDWRQLTWSDNYATTQEIVDSIAILCEQCKHAIKDTPAGRRSLSEHACYIEQPNNNALPGVVTYTFNALACYWIEWSTLAIEWLDASTKNKQGDKLPLLQFIQKRLAQHEYNEEEQDALKAVKNDDLLAMDWDGCTVDSEQARVLTVDVQKDCFYYTVYAMDSAGGMWLLDCGKAGTWSELEMIQQKHKVPSHGVGVDAGYRTEEVRRWCAKNKSIAMNGVLKDEFYHPRTGAKLPYDVPQKHYGSGGLCIQVNYSSQRAKSRFRAACEQRRVHTSKNTPRAFYEQIRNEYLKEVLDKRTGRVKEMWTTKTNNSHMLDTSAMAVVLFMMLQK